MKEKNRYDLIVVGAGTAGIFAAIAAARRGLKVLALEKLGYSGGTSTGGFIPGCYLQKPSGLMAELYLYDPEASSQKGFAGCIEFFKFQTEQAALDAGVDIRYNITLQNVTQTASHVSAISWLDDAQTSFEAEASFFCDCTAEANLCRLIDGVTLYGGRASDGEFQPFTNIICHWNGLRGANFDAGRINQADPEDFTQMQLQSSTVHLQDDFYNAERPIAAAGDLPGIREGVHVKTDLVQSLSDFFANPEQVDEPIYYAFSNIDTHSRDIVLESQDFTDWMIGCSMWGTELFFPVSRKTLLVSGFDNLLVPARHLGVDHDLGHALRMNPMMGAIGEVAGIWCALAVQHQVTDLRQVPYPELAQEIHLQTPSPDCNRNRIALPPDEIRAGMASPKPGFALWSSKKLPVAKLREAFAAALPESNEQCQYAFALALQNDDFGAELLRKLLQTRDARHPETSRKYNQDYGVSALYFLGRLGYAPACDTIFQVLRDPTLASSMEYIGGAIAALLHIGDKNPPLRHRIATELTPILADPNWDITARLKGTASQMKSMAFPLQSAAVRRFVAWGEHDLAHTLRLAARPSDNHEACKARQG
ncbi:MAG: FAD-dependent oxidoreductase [Victivallales bacterium]|nr:FAD-dependent oxidoreductase [Victivallales bacterium]